MNEKTLTLIGFFRPFRKHILPLGPVVLALIMVVGGPPGRAVAESSLARPEGKPCILVAASKSTVKEPYLGTDEQGDRQFGTNVETESGFARDPEGGDNTFRAKPRKQEEERYEGPQNIWVSPELKPGRPPRGSGRPR